MSLIPYGRNRAADRRDLRPVALHWSDMKNLDAIVLAVTHDYYKKAGLTRIVKRMKKNTGVLIDVKSLFHKKIKPERTFSYWCL